MTSVPIKGYNVGFPYATPYDLQKVYMEKVLTCLDDGRHGVLESPTGTGKTLCLFAPVAAWVTKRKQDRLESFYLEKDPEDSTNRDQSEVRIRKKVWYTSRTHAQIGQTVDEVRKCNIQNLDISVMGSREQLCINPEVMEEKEAHVKIVKCKALVKDRRCPYYQKYQRERESKRFYERGEVLDIEDLVSVGKTHNVCPYFMSKNAAEVADIVLLPYNYIIDRDAREGNSLDLNNDIIIFDEGHNIPAKCEESYEFTLTTLDLVTGVKSVQAFIEFLEKAPIEEDRTEIGIREHLENAEFIYHILEGLEKGMFRLGTTNELRPVAFLYQFFERAGIAPSTAERIFLSLSAFQEDASALNLQGNVIAIFHLLEKILIIMFGPTIKLFDAKTIEKSFKCGITIENKNKPNECKKISLFCFNPSFGIKTLLGLGVQSIIITSGTLSPIKTFIYELGLPEPVTLENGHIAKKCQVPFVILNQGVSNERMDSSFKNRDNVKYIHSLGNTLTNLISSIPDGVLLLFASYAMMENLKDEWESIGVWTRLESLKRVFIEPRGKEEFINCMENYRRAIDSGNGAVLLGVLRGKISEGMDFKDQYCRGVFIVGVPFPPVQDPKIKGKQTYCEDLTYLNPEKNVVEKLYTQSFTMIEAMKVTNQAVGRVIRHRNDYGAIILVDYRFAWSSLFFNISQWLRGYKAFPKNFQETKKILGEFFKNVHTGKLGVPEVRCQKVDENGRPMAEKIPFEEYDHRTAIREYSHAKEYVYDSPVKIELNESKTDFKPNFVKKEIVYDSPVKDYAHNTPVKQNNYSTSERIIKPAILTMGTGDDCDDIKPNFVKKEIVYDSPGKRYVVNTPIKKEHNYTVPVKPFSPVQQIKYEPVVVQSKPNASTSATLAYRNAAGKSSIVYEDDDSTDSDDTIIDATPSSVSFIQSDEEDTAMISAMDNLESSHRNFNEADSPLKDIANNKRKYLGETSDDSQSLIKSPCLERRSNSNNFYQRF